MKPFESGQFAYYVNPFIFTIEVVELELYYQDEMGIFWIDNIGAYLAERDLHHKLQDAKNDALFKLEKFYKQKTHEIVYQCPKIAEE